MHNRLENGRSAWDTLCNTTHNINSRNYLKPICLHGEHKQRDCIQGTTSVFCDFCATCYINFLTASDLHQIATFHKNTKNVLSEHTSGTRF
jgi:hypothetical protein